MLTDLFCKLFEQKSFLEKNFVEVLAYIILSQYYQKYFVNLKQKIKTKTPKKLFLKFRSKKLVKV